MQKQLKHTAGLNSKSVALEVALFFAVAFLCFSCYHFASRAHLLQPFYERYFKGSNLPGDQIYTIMETGIFLLAGILFLLWRQIILRRKLMEEMQLQKEHYRSAINVLPNDSAMRHTFPVDGDDVSERPDESFSHIFPYPAFAGGAGQITGAVGMLTSMTAENQSNILTEKEVEKNTFAKPLTESGAFITGVLDSINVHIAVINAAGTIIKTNAAWNNFALQNGAASLESCGDGANYFDVSRSVCSGAETIADKTREGIEQVLNGSLNEFDLEYACRTAMEVRWFYMRVKRFESEETLLVVEHHDMTERKAAELKVLKAVERYEILARATSDTIWDWDILNNKLLYNSGITKMFGHQISEVEDIFNWWKENVHPDDLHIVIDSYYNPIINTRETIQQEYRFRCADGTYKYIYDRAFVVYDESHKATRISGAMQDITYKKEEEKRIAKAIIDAQEKERRFIGEELHDNVNQLLASTLLTLEMVNHFQKEPEKVTEFTGRAKEYTLSALNEIRKLSHELLPATFDNITLKDIFETLLSGINLKSQYKVRFHFEEAINGLICQEVQICLYRILQEQVKNILKYADADTIEIAVTQTGHAVRMRTFDNGRGFDTKIVRGGIGLNNIKRRVESFAGKFILNSSPGKGCEIIVEIPYHHQRE